MSVNRIFLKIHFKFISLQESVYFRVNYEKFNIHIRNTVFVLPLGLHYPFMNNTCQIIEDGAKERFNLGAALVMRATLKATESSQLSISESRSCKSSPSTLG